MPRAQVHDLDMDTELWPSRIWWLSSVEETRELWTNCTSIIRVSFYFCVIFVTFQSFCNLKKFSKTHVLLFTFCSTFKKTRQMKSVIVTCQFHVKNHVKTNMISQANPKQFANQQLSNFSNVVDASKLIQEMLRKLGSLFVVVGSWKWRWPRRHLGFWLGSRARWRVEAKLSL